MNTPQLNHQCSPSKHTAIPNLKNISFIYLYFSTVSESSFCGLHNFMKAGKIWSQSPRMSILLPILGDWTTKKNIYL